MVAKHAGGGARASRLFRREEKRSSRNSTEAEGSDVIIRSRRPVPPRRNVRRRVLRPMQRLRRRMESRPAPSPFAAEEERKRANNFFQGRRVAAILRDSNKPHGLLT